MPGLVGLDDYDLSDHGFTVKLNELNLSLPQNLGRHFFEWWCGKIREREDVGRGAAAATPETVEAWLSGKDLPPMNDRGRILRSARSAIVGGASESDFRMLIRAVKDMVDAWFKRKDPSIQAWAEELFFHRIELGVPFDWNVIEGWFKDGAVPHWSLCMMIFRVVANAAMEVIMRDDMCDYQRYVRYKGD